MHIDHQGRADAGGQLGQVEQALDRQVAVLPGDQLAGRMRPVGGKLWGSRQGQEGRARLGGHIGLPRLQRPAGHDRPGRAAGVGRHEVHDRQGRLHPGDRAVGQAHMGGLLLEAHLDRREHRFAVGLDDQVVDERALQASGEIAGGGLGEIIGVEVGAAGRRVVLALGQIDQAAGNPVRRAHGGGQALELGGGKVARPHPPGPVGRAQIVIGRGGDRRQLVRSWAPAGGLHIVRQGDLAGLAGGGVHQIEPGPVRIVAADAHGVVLLLHLGGPGGGLAVGGDQGDPAAVGGEFIATGLDLDGVLDHHVPAGGQGLGGGAGDHQGLGLPAGHGQAIEVVDLAALGPEEQGLAVAGPGRRPLAALGVGAGPGELARTLAVGAQQPDVGLAALGRGGAKRRRHLGAVRRQGDLAQLADVADLIVERGLGGAGGEGGRPDRGAQGQRAGLRVETHPDPQTPPSRRRLTPP